MIRSPDALTITATALLAVGGMAMVAAPATWTPFALGAAALAGAGGRFVVCRSHTQRHVRQAMARIVGQAERRGPGRWCGRTHP